MKLKKDREKYLEPSEYIDLTDTISKEGCPMCGYDRPIFESESSIDHIRLLMWKSACPSCGQKWTDFFTFEGRVAKISKEKI